MLGLFLISAKHLDLHWNIALTRFLMTFQQILPMSILPVIALRLNSFLISRDQRKQPRPEDVVVNHGLTAFDDKVPLFNKAGLFCFTYTDRGLTTDKKA